MYPLDCRVKRAETDIWADTRVDMWGDTERQVLYTYGIEMEIAKALFSLVLLLCIYFKIHVLRVLYLYLPVVLSSPSLLASVY